MLPVFMGVQGKVACGQGKIGCGMCVDLIPVSGIGMADRVHSVTSHRFFLCEESIPWEYIFCNMKLHFMEFHYRKMHYIMKLSGGFP